jgi:hypothetical protein
MQITKCKPCYYHKDNNQKINIMKFWYSNPCISETFSIFLKILKTFESLIMFWCHLLKSQLLKIMHSQRRCFTVRDRDRKTEKFSAQMPSFCRSQVRDMFLLSLIFNDEYFSSSDWFAGILYIRNVYAAVNGWLKNCSRSYLKIIKIKYFD